jgi:hypothetical protein
MGGTGDICTFYSAKIFPPLTRFQLHPLVLVVAVLACVANENGYS